MEKRITIGETVDLEQPANYVELPDGTVVTARRHYLVQHEGLHVAGGTKFHGVPASEATEPEPEVEAPRPSTRKK